jgi:phosphate-selective porin OprO/OprP
MIRRALTAALALAMAPALTQAADGGWSVAPIGNLQYDFNRFRSDRFQFEDAHGFRRARLGLQVKNGSWFEAKMEFDLEPQQWTDVYVKLASERLGAVKLGHFKQPIGLEELTSSKWVTFMERGLPTALDLARRIGAEYSYAGSNWSVAGSYFTQDSVGANDGDGFALRGTWLPIRDDGDLLHLGVAVTTEDPDSGTARFRARPEARLTDRRLVDTGTLSNVDSIDRFGLEAAWVHGPWSVQSEYLRAEAQRDAGSDVAGNGWYVFGSWFPTGHSRTYKNGAFDAPKLADGEHAWEVGLRYSTIDLDDGGVNGGEQSDWTAGVTFYANKNVRFMANYVNVDSERNNVEDDPNILEFRAQLVF